MNRRGRFATWFRALSLGKKWAVGFGTFVAAYLIVVPTLNVVYVLLLYPDAQPEGTVKILCEEGTSHIFFPVDDPRWEPDGLSNADLDRVCALERGAQQ